LTGTAAIRNIATAACAGRGAKRKYRSFTVARTFITFAIITPFSSECRKWTRDIGGDIVRIVTRSIRNDWKMKQQLYDFTKKQEQMMNRDILFRGKRIETGKWVEGDLYHNYWR
jgi:hypothetical protein